MKYLIILLFFISFSLFSQDKEIQTYNKEIKKYNQQVDINIKERDKQKEKEKELKLKVEKEIDLIISKMTIEEKVGQLFNVAIVGKKLKPEYKKLIENYSIGGFTLFNYNMRSRKQIKSFIKELQSSSKIPLFISVDQEGGRITRYKYGKFLPPSPYLLGYINNLDTTKKVATYVAKDLHSIGINLNLAPLADILTDKRNHAIFDRSFSTKRDIVIEQVLAYVKALQANGVIATVKHFPGQGSLKQDTHLTLPISNISNKLIHKREILPFKKAIDNGVVAIMTSHVIFGALDPKLPATLSKSILKDILRKKLGYKYLVFTDGLEMKAILKTFGLKAAVTLALQNGIDIITLNWDIKNVKRAINYALDAVKNGEISQKEIDKKLKRILIVKKRFLYNSTNSCFCEKREKINQFLNSLYKKAIIYQNISLKELKNKKIYSNIRLFRKDKNIKYSRYISKDLKDSIIITSKNNLSKKIKKNNIIILLAPFIGVSKKYKTVILHDYNRYTIEIVKSLLNL